MSNFDEITHLMTTAQAVVFSKKVERQALGKFCMHYAGPAFLADQPDMFYDGGLRGYINLTHKEAQRIVASLLDQNTEARGGRIRIREVRSKYRTDNKATYWIG